MELNYRYLLFDLDGTLTDPRVGITKAVAYALQAFGIAVEDTDTLCKFIGPPLKESFMVYYEMNDEEAEKAVTIYREYFTDIGIYENVVYPGIWELMESLKTSGKSLILATSKPRIFAERILAHFKLDEYFEDIVGSELNGTRVKKGEVIAYALETNELTERSDVVMIGDRKHDIIGAKENGISSVGVLYGYGDLEELRQAGADRIAASVEELRALLL